MTPAELNTYAQAYVDRRKEEQRLAQVNLYSLAALIRPMVWSKHPPSFDKAFPGARGNPKARKMTDEQMYAMVCKLNASMGGKVVK